MMQNIQIKNWATYDEIAHEEYTNKLKNAGISSEEILNASMDYEYMQKVYDKLSYYQMLYY
jgi:hypothetical protein